MMTEPLPPADTPATTAISDAAFAWRIAASRAAEHSLNSSFLLANELAAQIKAVAVRRAAFGSDPSESNVPKANALQAEAEGLARTRGRRRTRNGGRPRAGPPLRGGTRPGRHAVTETIARQTRRIAIEAAGRTRRRQRDRPDPRRYFQHRNADRRTRACRSSRHQGRRAGSERGHSPSRATNRRCHRRSPQVDHG